MSSGLCRPDYEHEAAAPRGGPVLLGYGHVSLLEGLRPDLAHPGRKVRRARAVVTEITAVPCECEAGHLEVWAVVIPGPDA